MSKKNNIKIKEEEAPKKQDDGSLDQNTQNDPKNQKTQKIRKPKKIRGKRYLEVKKKVDPTKTYSLSEGLSLIKETSTTKFDGSVEIHLVVFKTGLKGEAELPHLEGKAKKVEVASAETLKKLESGKIDFDVLLTTPAMMPQLAKYAKLLGPKGLMPNPKSGTIADDPEKMAKNFEKPKFAYKTEASAPLIHTIFGKVSQPETELKVNFQALIKAIGQTNIKSLVIKSTMGPSIKIQL